MEEQLGEMMHYEQFIVGLPCARMAPYGVLSGEEEWRGEVTVRTQKRSSNVHQ